MSNFIKKINSVSRTHTTYRVGMLQSKAYRVLKKWTDEALSEYGITAVHWALIGLLFENKKGLQQNKIAQELGVEAPFVTRLIQELQRKKLIKSVSDATDSRAKCTLLTPQGYEFVSNAEGTLRNEISSLLVGIPLRDLASYLYVLERIIENSESTDSKNKK